MKRKNKIILYTLIGCVLIFLVCVVFGMVSRRNAEKKLYVEFLEGVRTINGVVITDIVFSSKEPDEQYFCEYAFFDCDGDGFVELHVRTQMDYYIVDCKDGELYFWKYLYPNTEVLNNGDFLYLHIGGAPLHYDYKYFVVNQEGEDIWSINFSCYDDNTDGQFDEKDLYILEGTDVLSYEEWEEMKNKYLSVGSDEVMWIAFTEKLE